jgi:hypothetical protein
LRFMNFSSRKIRALRLSLTLVTVSSVCLVAYAFMHSTSGNALPSPDNTRLVGNPAEIVRGAYFWPSDPTCANIRDYGGDKTGVKASDAAFDAAVAATSPNRLCVYLPAGSYLFHTAHSISLPSSAPSASITIRGDGPDVTKLTFDRGTSGLAFSLNHASHSFHIRDLSILGGAYSTRTVGIAAEQNAVVPNPAYAAQSDISGVAVRGADGLANQNGFGVGMSMLKNSNVNFINDYIIGPGSAVSKCIDLSGTTENIAVVFNIIGSTLNSCAVGLYYGVNVQGVSITSTNMTGNRTGIYSPAGAANLSQLSVSASQFANVDFDINLQTDPGGTAIAGNYFLADARSTSGRARINLAAAKNTSISGNIFQGIASINAVVVQTPADPWSMIITGNTFNQFGTAIWLQRPSRRVTVGINAFNGNRTNILNEGQENTVPASSCAGPPTPAFSVSNGIITHC